MKFYSIAFAVLAARPAFCIPPPSFGFLEAPNDTALVVTYTNNTVVQEAALFGSGITTSKPNVAMNVGGFQSLAEYNGTYTVIMVDPDASTPDNPTSRYILHWLAPNMMQSSTSSQGLRTLSNSSVAFVEYASPSPPANSSAHRYIQYAFRQPSNFTIPSQYMSFAGGKTRAKFNITQFASDTGLGEPAAAMFYYVSKNTQVPQNFTAAPGGTFPGGNGDMITDQTAAAASSSGSSGSTATASGSGSTASATSSSSSSSSSGSSSSSSGATAPQESSMAGLVAAGILGAAALLW